MNRIELERKGTNQDHIDVGLFYLPDNKSTPYVTWLINKSKDPEFRVLGNYFTHLIPAVEDFQNRG